MGLFDRLFRRTPSNVKLLPDRIWLSEAAKFAGLHREVEAALRSQETLSAVILVAHFEDSLDRLQGIADRVVDGPPIDVTTADRLSHRVESKPNQPQTVLLLVSERHPLRSHDDRIVEFARSLPCRCRLAFHMSLEDPVMRLFAGGWIESTLRKLGMSEDKAIESEMIGRRIATAQQKIESQCQGNLAARSAEEWLRKNCPEMGRDGA